ncbi:cation:proton antiporter [Alicyclobacillus cycloheptanicus]|uniref:Kef-type K+ transport system membrane component KefB n=1 Tax=Alicyclobacillus cycloheptanicus TaxID=1457 RepID=A0ABT9XIU8_9BACL|nr:cation:proton antiporter [Alicyclobacillus cycloheptanicus]MDQ0189708.1 Kef-type K+ transport system membrane component KefB [Alicyclobacillus cycloheptanicus]WDM01920.1 cation:proton antiporter [Alicyclobacillus cycloheptanicus]
MSETLRVFLLILSASFVFSAAVSKIPLLRIPSSVAYLLFGVMLHLGSAHVSSEELLWINQLGDFGLLFLMFLSGMEVEFQQLHPSAWKASEENPLTLAAAMFCATLLLSFACAWVLARFSPGVHPWMLTLLFATTSLGVILPILEETGTLATAYGQTLLLCALFADFLTMLFVSLFVSVRTSGSALDFLLALSILPAGVGAYFAIQWMRGIAAVRRLAGDSQMRMRAVLALVAGACAFADFTGAEPILGSFLAGMVVSAVPFAHKQRLKTYCHGLGYGFLIPMFFISVGLHFHFGAFREPSAWLWVPALLMVAFLVKVVPALRLFRQFGTKAALAGGFLMSSRLSLVAAAAIIGVHIGAMTPILAQSMILAAVVTCLISPVLFVSMV